MLRGILVSLITITRETTAGITKWGVSLKGGMPRFLFNGNDDVNVDGLGLSVEGDSSQTQNDEADDGGNVEGLGISVDGDSSQAQNDKTNDNGNNKASTKSVLQLRLYSEVMCIFVLYLVEYRLFRLF